MPLNYAISHRMNEDGRGSDPDCVVINMNLSGPDARLQAITFTIHEDERDAILDALASGEVERRVLDALERVYSAEVVG